LALLAAKRTADAIGDLLEQLRQLLSAPAKFRLIERLLLGEGMRQSKGRKRGNKEKGGC
jgi:hypothetical protein